MPRIIKENLFTEEELQAIAYISYRVGGCPINSHRKIWNSIATKMEKRFGCFGNSDWYNNIHNKCSRNNIYFEDYTN